MCRSAQGAVIYLSAIEARFGVVDGPATVTGKYASIPTPDFADLRAGFFFAECDAPLCEFNASVP
jgi:hypothetical protein